MFFKSPLITNEFLDQIDYAEISGLAQNYCLNQKTMQQNLSIRKLRRKSRRNYDKIFPKTKTCICFWCKETIVWLSRIPKQDRIEIIAKRFLATVIIEGQQQTLKIASIDHLNEIRNGGNEDINNIVPSCIPCNMYRDRDKRRIIFCQRCNSPKVGLKIYCKNCRKHLGKQRRSKLESKFSFCLGRS